MCWSNNVQMLTLSKIELLRVTELYCQEQIFLLIEAALGIGEMQHVCVAKALENTEFESSEVTMRFHTYTA
ncbi:hypothetical protein Plhal304r1_c037g0112881 [Plasmopara halstedii]